MKDPVSSKAAPVTVGAGAKETPALLNGGWGVGVDVGVKTLLDTVEKVGMAGVDTAFEILTLVLVDPEGMESV